MKTVKKFAAVSLLIIGLSILLLGITDLINPKKTNQEKEGAADAIYLFSLPSTVIGTWIIWSLRQQDQQQLKKLNLEREQLLLHLLQQEEGKITATKFALSALISIEESKEYLNEKAKQLDGQFEISEHGEIIYIFPI